MSTDLLPEPEPEAETVDDVDASSYLRDHPRVFLGAAIAIVLGTIAVVTMVAHYAGTTENSDDSRKAVASRDADDPLSTLWRVEKTETDEPSYHKRNKRIREAAEGYAERYQIEESHSVNRSKAFVLEQTRDIDIDSEIDTFERVHSTWDNLVSELLVSDDGRRLAQDEALLEGFIELYSKRPLRPEWAKAMREQLDILLRPVVDTIPKKYSQAPGAQLQNEIRDVATKASSTAEQIKRDISILRGLMARAPKNVPANAPTLAKAIIAYDAKQKSQEFLDLRNAKKQAAEQAKRDRDAAILREQRESEARTARLQAQTKYTELQGQTHGEPIGLGELVQAIERAQKEEEKLNEQRRAMQATKGASEETNPEKTEQTGRFHAPTREELESSADWSFALAQYFVNMDSPRAKRGGVVHADYNALVAPKGTEPCQIWRSADGESVFVHADGVTLGFRASDVRSIVYPTRLSE